MSANYDSHQPDERGFCVRGDGRWPCDYAEKCDELTTEIERREQAERKCDLLRRSNEVLRQEWQCSVHPNVNSVWLNSWGCPDCLHEAGLRCSRAETALTQVIQAIEQANELVMRSEWRGEGGEP